MDCLCQYCLENEIYAVVVVNDATINDAIVKIFFLISFRKGI